MYEMGFTIIESYCFRHWMVTRQDGRYYTLMTNTKFCQITPNFEDNTLCLNKEGVETLRIPLDPEVKDANIKIVKLVMPMYQRYPNHTWINIKVC